MAADDAVIRFLHTHLVACLALFVALGGTSYAVVRLPANSVTTRQVKDFSLLRRDFRRGQLRAGPLGTAGRRGAVGAQGPVGAVGPVGDTGDPGRAASGMLTGRVTVPSMKTGFAAPVGAGAFVPSVSEYVAAQRSPNTTLTAQDLAVTGVAGTGTVTVRLRINFADTALFCKMTAPVNHCDSGGTQVTIPPGAALTLAVENTDLDFPAIVRYGWRAT